MYRYMYVCNYNYRATLIFLLILIHFIFLKDEMKELYDDEIIKIWPDFAKMILRLVSDSMHHLSQYLTFYIYLSEASDFIYINIKPF